MPKRILDPLARISCSVALFALVLISGACSGQKRASLDKGPAMISPNGGSRDSVAPQDIGGPHPEGPIVIQAVEKGKEEILLVYKHTAHGYLETYGYDTLVFRFSSLPGGWLTGAIVSARMLDGERDVAAFDFSRAGDEIYVARDLYSDGKAPSADPFATIKPEGNGLSLRSGGSIRTFALPAGGSLEFGSFGGTIKERWVGRRGAADSGSTISKSGETIATGHFSFPVEAKAEYAERKTGDIDGAEDLSCSVWFDAEGSWRFRVESVEPVCEGYASGLEEALAGGKTLENMALIEAVLGGEAAIHPLFALATGSSPKTDASPKK